MDKNSSSSGERKLNCGEEHKCFQLIESILDGENVADSKEILDEKLAKCQPCFEYYQMEQVIKEVLKTKCTMQPVPHELAASIRQKIEEIR